MAELFDNIDGLEGHLDEDSFIDLDIDSKPEKDLTVINEDSIDKDLIKKPGENAEEDFLIDLDLDIPADVNKNEIDNTEEKVPSKSSPSTTDSKVKAYTIFMENLYNSGALSSFDKEAFTKAIEGGKDPDELIVEAKKIEIEKKVEEKLSNMTADDRAIYEGKQSNIPLDELGNIDRALKFYNSVDDSYLDNPDNEDVLKRMISSDLLGKGFSEEEVKEQLEIYEEKDIIVAKAKKSADNLKIILSNQRTDLMETATKTKTDNAAKIEGYKKELKTIIDQTPEIIPGITLDSKMHKQLYDDLTVPVRYDANNKPIDIIADTRDKNPKMFDVILRYYNRLGLFNFEEDGTFKPDFSKVSNDIRTKEVKKIRSIVEDVDSFISGDSKKVARKDTADLFGGI